MLVGMGIRVVLILGWGMIGMRRTRQRGGLGGIGGSDMGQRLVYRSWESGDFACRCRIFKGLKGSCEMSCIELWLFDIHIHPCVLVFDTPYSLWVSWWV